MHDVEAIINKEFENVVSKVIDITSVYFLCDFRGVRFRYDPDILGHDEVDVSFYTDSNVGITFKQVVDGLSKFGPMPKEPPKSLPKEGHVSWSWFRRIAYFCIIGWFYYQADPYDKDCGYDDTNVAVRDFNPKEIFYITNQAHSQWLLGGELGVERKIV